MIFISCFITLQSYKFLYDQWGRTYIEGKVNLKQTPPAVVLLFAVIVPPWASIAFLHKVRPIPLPSAGV